MLNSLAIQLGAALGQERLYLSFCQRTWILDADATSERRSVIVSDEIGGAT